MADGVSVKVGNAKAALAQANKAFPSPAKPAAPAVKSAAAPVKSSSFDGGAGVGAELKAKSDNVDQYMKSIPKMHNGGPVVGDGPRMLKDGEHVLTAAEAKKARKHAMLAAGLKSLAKDVPAKKKTAGEPVEMDDVQKQPASKKSTSGINVRPEKSQSAKIKVRA